MPLLNIFFIFSFAKNLSQLLLFFIFLLVGFFSIKMIENYPSQKNAILSISVIVCIFIYLKKYSFVSFAPFIKWPYFSIGLSYILFRVLHILVDTYGGALQKKISLITFFNYTCSFFTLISGPIQRFQDYEQQESNLSLEENKITEQESYKFFSRFLNGYLKITVLSSLFFYIHKSFYSCLDSIQYQSTLHALQVFYLGASCFYTLYLYYNFSGYMDIVISIGSFLGMRIPENFNKPFASKSFLEFWSRWHITLSDWFKFYVFNPMLKLFVYRSRRSKFTPYYAVFAFFVTFLLIGIWHGSSFGFVIFGILLGLGASLNKLYDLEIRKRLARIYFNNLSKNNIYKSACSALTYVYFTICLTFMWLSLDKQMYFFMKIGIVGFLVTFLIGGAVVAGIMQFLKSVVYLFRRISLRINFLVSNFYFQQGYLSLKAFILILVLILKVFYVPEFVYKAF